MKKLILPLLAVSFSLFVSCGDDEPTPKPKPNPSTGTDLSKMVDAKGNWNAEAIKLFEAKLGVDAKATGADMSKFAWTVSEKGTTLPTNLTATAKLEGEIKKDMTLDATKVYELVSDVYVRKGATLTIPAGTVIFANPDNNKSGAAADVLIIDQGGKLVAEGTAKKPIIFTSNAKSPKAGDWGGVVLLGNAPTNLKGGTGTSEVSSNVSDKTLPYGGKKADDNSGSLKYVILAYPGTQITSESEYNGFSFYALGSGTTLENLEVYQGKDDGFEWYGGTVNAKNLYSVAYDDSFDWTEGYTGTLDNIVANQPTKADHCIEADNLKADHKAKPVASPSIKNATLKSSSKSDHAVKLRRGTAAKFDNVLIEMKNAEKANFIIDDLVTGQNILDGKTTFKKIKVATPNKKFVGNANK